MWSNRPVVDPVGLVRGATRERRHFQEALGSCRAFKNAPGAISLASVERHFRLTALHQIRPLNTMYPMQRIKGPNDPPPGPSDIVSTREPCCCQIRTWGQKTTINNYAGFVTRPSDASAVAPNSNPKPVSTPEEGSGTIVEASPACVNGVAKTFPTGLQAELAELPDSQP